MIIIVDQYVIWFQVPMEKPLLVNVMQPIHQTKHDCLDLLLHKVLSSFPLFLDQIMQVCG